MSVQPLADSVTGEKRFVLPDFGGPGKCVLLVDADRSVVARLTPAEAVVTVRRSVIVTVTVLALVVCLCHPAHGESHC